MPRYLHFQYHRISTIQRVNNPRYGRVSNTVKIFSIEVPIIDYQELQCLRRMLVINILSLSFFLFLFPPPVGRLSRSLDVYAIDGGPGIHALLPSSWPLVRRINRHDLKNVVPNTVSRPVRPSVRLGETTDEIVLLMPRLLASFSLIAAAWRGEREREREKDGAWGHRGW